MDEAEKYWRAEQWMRTSNNLAALSYLAIANGISGRDKLGISLATECRELAEKMGYLGVRPTDQMVSTFHCLPLDEMKSSAFAAWGTYAWLTSVVATFPENLILTITVTAASTTQPSQLNHHLSSQFPEIPIGRQIIILSSSGRPIHYLSTWDRPFKRSASSGSLSKRSIRYTL